MALNTPEDCCLWACFGHIVLGYIFADMYTGFGHWFVDSYFEHFKAYVVQRKWLYKACAFVTSNAPDHHEHPSAFLELPTHFMLRQGLWQSGTAVLALRWAFGANAYFCASAFFWGALTHLAHAWSHTREDRNPRPVRWAQRLRLLNPTAAHRAHHRDYVGDYNIIGGLLNPALDALGFWRLLETVLFRGFGVPVHASDRPADRKGAMYLW